MDVNPREFKRAPEGSVRINRAETADESMGEEKMGMGEGGFGHAHMHRRSRGPWILVIAVIIVLAVLGYVYRDKLSASKTTSGPGATTAFQAVFLTNGQVYFGKLTDTGDRYVKLENIYYLQITPVLQTKTEGDPGTQATPQQQLSLVKLGNELHGPVDHMSINRDHVLFVEDLKEDGRVVQAIKEYEQGQQK
ncbi:MAG: hypothetical protein HY397_01550 [Candidatus Doudnabacteria bacterium]|nr:hypothetical protein [Candidatus Doudnabacteria bacterium]